MRRPKNRPRRANARANGIAKPTASNVDSVACSSVKRMMESVAGLRSSCQTATSRTSKISPPTAPPTSNNTPTMAAMPNISPPPDILCRRRQSSRSCTYINDSCADDSHAVTAATPAQTHPPNPPDSRQPSRHPATTPPPAAPTPRTPPVTRRAASSPDTSSSRSVSPPEIRRLR